MMIHEQIKVLTFFFLSSHLLSKPVTVMGFTTGDSVKSTKTFGWLLVNLGLSALSDSISVNLEPSLRGRERQ